ncbi:MAG: choice-of-anchor Q domain-containing protein [Thermoleophilaceae bacterium]
MRTRVALAATIATAAAAAALLAPAGAGASIYDCSPGCDIVVNSTVDAPDADAADGACATAAGDCTLRAAIQEANARVQAVVLVPRGTYVLTRHGLDDDASHGDLDITSPVRVIGAGVSRTIVDGDDADRVFDVRQFGEGSISHLAVRHGRATDGPGGGIWVHNYPFALRYLYVTDNEAVGGAAAGSGNGGGIAAQADTAVQYAQVAYNHAVNGAGMYWHGIQASSSNDTFVGNHASGDGGGLYISGGDDFLNNMTLSANTAAAHGGGVYLEEPDPYGGIVLGGFTVASNSAPSAMGGGIWIADQAHEDFHSQHVNSSIFAGNGSGGDCAGTGTLNSHGGNIDGDGSCGFAQAHDLTGVDPLLDDPAYNGGPVQTRALEDGSPGIDLIPCSADTAGTDARGVSRPQGAACDSGAFELGDCCPDYEPPYVPAEEQPPPPPKEGSCGVLRFGTAGDDLLVGDRGHNQIYGRAGNDHIYGRFQSDCLYGGRGADFIRGGEGTDLLVGFTGADHLSGGDQEDVVRGGRGNDRILGGADEDRLFGGPGADYVKGGDGYDTIDAGPGNDTIDATGGGLDAVDCGTGDDRVRAKRHEHLIGCEHVHYVD